MAESLRSEDVSIQIKANLEAFDKIDERFSKLQEKARILNERVGNLFKETPNTRFFSSLNRQLGTTDKRLDSVQNSALSFKNSFKEMTGSLPTYEKNMRGVNSAQKEFSTRNKSITSSVDKSRQALGKFNNSSTSRVSRSVDSTNKSVKRMHISTKSLNATGDKFLNVGRNMAITSTAIGAAMVKGANDAIKLQNQYRVINNLAVYGGEKQSKVTKNVGKMQNQAAKYSTQYGVAQTKLSAGYEELVRRGYDSNQVLAAQKTFLQGSLASGDDYTDVVHNGAAALEQFGMRTKNTNQMMQNTKTVINQMAYAADLTATDFQGMGDAFRYVGNTAHTANQSVAETAAGVGILSNAGMEDTVAGTGYRKVLNSFLSPNMGKMSQQAPIMEKFGWTKKSFEDSKGNLKSIADLMDMVNKKTKNMGGAEKADVFKRFFGTTGQEAAIALSRDTKGLRRLTDQVSRSQNMKGGGYIAQLSKKNLMSAKAQIDIFKQAVSGLGISFATTVLPNITGLVKGLDKMLFAINEMPKGTKKFVTSGIALAAGIAPISLALGGLLKGISMAKTAWSSMAKVMRKPINGGSLQSASNATEAIANEEETAVGSTGSRMGTTHFSNAKNSVRGSGFKSQWNNSSLMGKLAVGAVGLDIGYDFVKATKQGLDTAAGGQTLWNGAGKTIGGGLGFYLGGPQGAVMGASIGDGITKALTAKKIDKYLSSNSTGKDPNAKIVEKDKHQQKKLRKRYYTQGTPDSDDANKVLGQLNSKPFRHQRKSKASDPYKGLSKDTKSFLKDTHSEVTKANDNFLNILGTGSKAAVSVNKSTYSKVLTTAKSYSKSQTTSADKSINYLKKIGAISGSEQAKQLQKEKGSGAKRVNDIKSTISKIEKAEKNGGTDRAALVSKLNRQLLKLTDAGTNKQKRLYKDLKENVGHLTTSQYSTVMKKSRAARKQTISDAKKQYNSQTSTAFKTYKKTLKSAKQIYGVHSSMYKSIKGSADKQYDKTTSAAYRQYKKTVKYANQQAKEVVQAAANAAGGINGIMGVMSNNIDDLGKQLAKAVGGTWQKPKSNDQSFHDNTNPAGNLAKGAKKLQNKETSSVLKSGPSVKLTSSSSVFSKATGGSIFKHGMSMVGENGFELLQRGKSFKLIGRHGAQLMQVGPGDRIYKHADAVAMTKGSYGERIPGFASGNAKPKQKKKVAVPDAASVAKVNSMGGTETVVKRSMSKISKSIAKGYSSGTEKSNKSISKFKSKNSSEWKSIHKTTDKYTNQIRKGTVSDFDQMQKGSQKQMIQLHKGLNSAAKATTSDFGDIMGRLKPYAHKAMGGAITSLNGGISGINSTLSQFGGNKSVLKPIHYATGSKGPIRSDQMAVLNDAKSGPRQELVARGGQLLKPEGKDVLTPLKKGDEVLNGAQVAHARQFLPHFAKGTGVSKDKLLSLIEKNSGKPNDAWKSDFTSHLTDGSGPQLASGVQSLGTKAANSKGVPWNAAAWSVMNAAAQSGGAGGNWRHDPGMTKSNGFGASRSFGSHDGVDFTGPQGTPIKAVHGGIVTRAGKPVWDFKDLGYVVTVKSDDGWQEIYQEFGNASHIKAHVGQTIKTGDTVATQGGIIGSSTGPHVHIGVSKGSLWNHGGSSTRGWYDVTKMQGSSNGTAKAPKANTALQKFAKNQLNAAGVLPWITKNIAPLTEDDSGGGGTSAAPSGSHKHWLEQAGIPANQFGAYNAIITPESGWNPKIHNPSSSAYGLPQALPGSKMASAGSDWKTNPITQLKWMKGYVKGRYGGINQALSFRKAHGWYAKGGTPPLNSWVGVNEEGQELFKTKKSGKIVPHKESQRLVSKATGGGTKIAPQYNVKVEVNGNADDAAITAAVKRALKEHDEELIARINAQSGDDSSYEFI